MLVGGGVDVPALGGRAGTAAVKLFSFQPSPTIHIAGRRLFRPLRTSSIISLRRRTLVQTDAKPV